MVDQIKKTRIATEGDKAALDELSEKSEINKVVDTVSGMHDIMQYTAERFNALREQLSVCCNLIRAQDSEAMKHIIMSKALAQGDYGYLLDRDISTFNYSVEDAAGFAKLMATVNNTKRIDTRMLICVEHLKKIQEAIENWRSKLTKLRMLSSVTGSTEAEVKAANKMGRQIEEAIAVLRKRAKLLSGLFVDTRSQVTKLLSEVNATFNSLDYGED